MLSFEGQLFYGLMWFFPPLHTENVRYKSVMLLSQCDDVRRENGHSKDNALS
ncbi:MAG: hypothetical protein QG577_1958 [Thermodesulfobacteriota bacterium]|nr:hypothetical protein [Thermodesulfobacteriota bacterium]